MEQFTTVKIWVPTRRLLRKIAAETDVSMVEAVHRLASAEWRRLKAIERDEPEVQGRRREG